MTAAAALLAVIFTCLALVPADHADQQQAMADEWLTYIDSLPVTTEDKP